jgi:hypothetical protein
MDNIFSFAAGIVFLKSWNTKLLVQADCPIAAAAIDPSLRPHVQTKGRQTASFVTLK